MNTRSSSATIHRLKTWLYITTINSSCGRMHQHLQDVKVSNPKLCHVQGSSEKMFPKLVFALFAAWNCCFYGLWCETGGAWIIYSWHADTEPVRTDMSSLVMNRQTANLLRVTEQNISILVDLYAHPSYWVNTVLWVALFQLRTVSRPVTQCILCPSLSFCLILVQAICYKHSSNNAAWGQRI